MITFTDTPLEMVGTGVRENLYLRKKVFFIACLELVSAMGFISMFFFVRTNSEGYMSKTLQEMTLIAVLMVTGNGALLMFGTLKESYIALDLAFWWSIQKALYNLLLGCTGGNYFMVHGEVTIHFLIYFAYGMIALSFFSTFCHDLRLIHSLTRRLQLIAEMEAHMGAQMGAQMGAHMGAEMVASNAEEKKRNIM